MIKREPLIGMLAAAAILLLWNGAGADFYKWIDQGGAVHLADIPPRKAGKVQYREGRPASLADSSLPAQTPTLADTSSPESSPTEPSPEKTPPAAKAELYVTKWCKYCTLARNYLRSKNVAFVEYDIEKDSKAAKRRDALDKRPGVPLAVINGTVILGFSEAAYEKALKRR